MCVVCVAEDLNSGLQVDWSGALPPELFPQPRNLLANLLMQKILSDGFRNIVLFSLLFYTLQSMSLKINDSIGVLVESTFRSTSKLI